MTLESLCKVMPPPPVPIETGGIEEWLVVEEAVGISLPNDYKQYIRVFGTGCIGGFLWPLNPFSENDNLNLLKGMVAILGALRSLKDKWGDRQCPYPLYPEPGGLLPWGVTDNGDVLFWLTEGCSDEWSVVINEARAPVYEEYEESITGFLTKLVLREIVSEIIPPGFLDRDALFVSRK